MSENSMAAIFGLAVALGLRGSEAQVSLINPEAPANTFRRRDPTS